MVILPNRPFLLLRYPTVNSTSNNYNVGCMARPPARYCWRLCSALPITPDALTAPRSPHSTATQLLTLVPPNCSRFSPLPQAKDWEMVTRVVPPIDEVTSARLDARRLVPEVARRAVRRGAVMAMAGELDTFLRASSPGSRPEGVVSPL